MAWQNPGRESSAKAMKGSSLSRVMKQMLSVHSRRESGDGVAARRVHSVQPEELPTALVGDEAQETKLFFRRDLF